jgi:LCP family protein required for cell wall assembly
MAGGTVIGLISHNKFGGVILNDMWHHPFQQMLHPLDPMATMQPENTFEADDMNGFNLLILGCDVDYVNDKPIPINSSNGGRSDAMMVAHIDFTTGMVNILSIPRDTYCRIPDHGIHKINAATAFGGWQLAQATVKSVFGIDSKYCVRMNFIGFQKAVQELGGVNLDVEKRLDYDDNWGHLHVHLKPGYQHLSGYQAMGYVRMRHSDSDLMRSERQHKFIEAMRDQVKNPSNLRHLPGVLDAITDAISTNMKRDQLLTIVNFMQRLPKDKIALATLPVDEGPSYVYVKVKQSEEMIRKMFFTDGEPVSINVPSYSLVRASERSYGRRRGRKPGAHAPAGAPTDDDGQPMLSNPDEDSSGPDTVSDTPSSSDDSGSDRPSASPDSGANSGDSKPSDQPKPSTPPTPAKPETPSPEDSPTNNATPHGQPG